MCAVCLGVAWWILIVVFCIETIFNVKTVWFEKRLLNNYLDTESRDV